MKRTLSLVLALVMVLGTFTGVFAAENTAVDAADFLKANEVLEGDDNGNLNLDKTLLRQDMVVMISRLYGQEEDAEEFPAEDLTFEDFTNPYYRSIIAWAVENELIEGHDEKTFGFNENVIAQDYATVLLRAMGKEFKYENALEEAKALGLLAGVEVVNKTEILRSQMAVMTVNALEAEGGKLAEKLGIELPKPVALEVESVYADNLKQVVVEFNQKVDEDSAEKLDNYTFVKEFKTAEVLEDGKTVVLTIKEDVDALVNQKEYKLTVNNILAANSEVKVAKTELKFVAVDKTLPTVEEVVGLGTKAIQVIFSEPVTQATANKMASYKIDDKVISGSIKYVYPNSVIISTNMTVGEHKLSVKDVADFANFKVQEPGFEFTIAEDNNAPEIESAKSIDLKKVELTFNEPVKAVSNGYHTSKSNLATKPISISGNKVTLTFVNPMSLANTTIYVDGVEDYSGNKADRTFVITPELDQTRPEVVTVEVKDGKDFTVTFNKSLNETSAETNANYIVKNSEGKVPAGYGLNTKGNPIVKPVYTESKKEVTFSMTKALPKGSYTLEITGVQDDSFIKNTIIPHIEAFEIGDTGKPSISSAWLGSELVADSKTAQYLYVQFSEAVATEGNGNALEIIKYNYTGNVTVDAYSAWTPVEKGSTIDLITEDTVRINLPAVTTPRTIKGVRVTMVSDLEENFLQDYVAYHVVTGVKTAIAIESAEATATDIVEATFNGKLASVSASDFVIKSGATTKNLVLEETKTKDGKTVATFRIADGYKVTEDVYTAGSVAWKFATLSEGLSSQDSVGTVIAVDTVGKTVEDAIKATIDHEIGMTNVNTTSFQVTFNENIAATFTAGTISVKLNGVAKTINGVTVSGKVLTVNADLTGLTSTDIVEFSILEANTTVKAIKDLAGNAAVVDTLYNK